MTPYWPDGYWGNYFNGSTDSVSTTQSMVLPTSTTPFTIELWANFTSFSSVAIASTTNSSGIFFVLGMGTGNGGATGTTPWFGYFNGSAWTSIQSSTSLVVGTWYHLAYVFTGSTATIYANGIVIASGSVASWQMTGGAGLYIGRRWDTSTPGPYFNGYISNFRYVIGAALYSGSSTTVPNFTVPTTPLTSSPSSGTTKILTCQSNRFKDNSANNYALTANGTPLVQAFQPFSPAASYTTAAYGGSGYFNGTTDYLTTATTAALDLTSGDWTIQGWYYPTSYSSSNNVIAYIGSATGNKLVVATIGTAGNLYYLLNGSVTISSATAAPLNAWSFYALVKSGATTTLYLNGVSLGTTTSVPTTSNKSLSLGSDAGASIYQGYFGDFRVLKGTASSTIPTAPLTAITNTSLLTNFTNAGIYDAAVQNNVITVGDAQASTTQSKWSPTSMKFDGTGDWLTAIDGPQLQLGTGDFTIDGWLYLSANGMVYGIISKGTATTGWSVNVTALNKLQFSYTASNLTGTTSLAASTWYYFAVVRSGSATGNLKVYLNGSVEATSGGAVTDNFNQTNILYVGADRIGATPLNGYLQDVRITKAARTITTPTAAFPTR